MASRTGRTHASGTTSRPEQAVRRFAAPQPDGSTPRCARKAAPSSRRCRSRAATGGSRPPATAPATARIPTVSWRLSAGIRIRSGSQDSSSPSRTGRSTPSVHHRRPGPAWGPAEPPGAERRPRRGPGQADTTGIPRYRSWCTPPWCQPTGSRLPRPRCPAAIRRNARRTAGASRGPWQARVRSAAKPEPRTRCREPLRRGGTAPTGIRTR